MALRPAVIAAELRSVLERIEATFDEDAADKWTADRQLCLEDESRLSALVQRIEADPS
jgi:hypothetical protein